MLSAGKIGKGIVMIVSLKFVLFLIAVLILYYIIPNKGKKPLLLATNVLFYGSFGIQNLLILGSMILLSFYGAVWIRRKRDKRVFIVFLVITLLPLVLLKYTDMTTLAEPIGISFFTFKVVSFLADIYMDRSNAGYGLLDYSIYVSFFPSITSGPIDRADAFMKQLTTPKRFEERRFLEGLLLVLGGYFQKMIIADRLAIIVGAVFDEYTSYTGFPLLLTSVFYTLQIYFDFAGYTCIARGIATALGYECQKNFRQPYFSASIREFWQRWHMSLSGWLRDYIYIPLGGNRKGTTRKYVNLLLTFLVSGIWHGAGWNFVAWGLLHGIYQVIGALTQEGRNRMKEKLHIRGTIVEWGIQIGITFLLVNFAWVLFRGNGGLGACIDILQRMLVPSGISFYWIWNSGVGKLEFLIMSAALFAAFITDVLNSRGVLLTEKYFRLPVIARFACLYAMFFAIVLFGVYGPGYDASSFIYFQF